jgi:hypothetical protein
VQCVSPVPALFSIYLFPQPIHLTEAVTKLLTPSICTSFSKFWPWTSKFNIFIKMIIENQNWTSNGFHPEQALSGKIDLIHLWYIRPLRKQLVFPNYCIYWNGLWDKVSFPVKGRRGNSNHHRNSIRGYFSKKVFYCLPIHNTEQLNIERIVHGIKWLKPPTLSRNANIYF